MSDESKNQPTTQNPEPETELSELRAKTEEYLAGWKRALADYENAMKMNAQSREEDKKRVRASLAEDLLPVIDNFGYVLKHVPDTSSCSEDFQKKFDTWAEGINHISRQFTEALRNLGVEPIATVGEQFNPHLHESGGSKKDENQPDGVVLEEVIRGWKIGERVLRPAKVIVNEL